MMKKIHHLLVVAALAMSSQVMAADWVPGTADWDKVPEIKRTKLSLYLTPQQAYEMKAKQGNKVALFDIRTRAEAMFVGMPTDADALVPFMEQQELMTGWDDKRNAYLLEPNQDFVPEVERRIAEMKLGKDATIILLCRSGDRSAKAADRLQAAGYTKVYSVVEGFEGDIAKDGPKAGQRSVNGWKNAGLPWSYKLDKSKVYFQR
jgi:rhodanese-related sulfurtransferase